MNFLHKSGEVFIFLGVVDIGTPEIGILRIHNCSFLWIGDLSFLLSDKTMAFSGIFADILSFKGFFERSFVWLYPADDFTKGIFYLVVLAD